MMLSCERGIAMTPNHPHRLVQRLTITLPALGALWGLELTRQRADSAGADKAPQRLTSRPWQAPAEVKTATLGEEVHTTAGQRRRLLLPGGSVLYVNEHTTVKL